MVILEAYHPVVIAAQLEIRLLEAVGMQPLEPFPSPSLSGLCNWFVQTLLADYSVNSVVRHAEAPLSKIALDLAGAPLIPFPQLHNPSS
jgi:hypothetical protein